MLNLILSAFAIAIGLIGPAMAQERILISSDWGKVTAQLVDNEAPAEPLSDHRLAKLLAQRGIRIARRTVTKYRDALGIEAADLRRQLHHPGADAAPADGLGRGKAKDGDGKAKEAAPRRVKVSRPPATPRRPASGSTLHA